MGNENLNIPNPTLQLSNEEILRYSRHLLIPNVGMEGQKKLKAARVLVIGVGGLGSPASLYLAAAGVGTLGLVDYDVVDLTNLQRQILHTTKSVGRSKIQSAQEKLLDINPNVHVKTYPTRLSSTNALKILADYDVIIDGTDNFPTRYLVNDACVFLKKPNVYGSIYRFDGQVSVFDSTIGPCYRCLYPSPPPPEMVANCAEGGVLGVLPGVIGSLQALEVIKLIIGQGEPLIGRLLFFDALNLKFHEVRIQKDPKCVICSERPTITSLIDYDEFCGVTTEASIEADAITPEELKKRFDRGDNILLLDVREPDEFKICNIGGQLIPIPNLANRYAELDPSREIIVYCKTGNRSRRAVQFLQRQGFRNVKNLIGGIDAWAARIDHSMPRY